MNRDCVAMMALALTRGVDVLMLTNAMRPMMRRQEQLKQLGEAHGGLLRFRVSLDSHHAAVHDAERGAGSFAKAMEGLSVPLPGHDAPLHITISIGVAALSVLNADADALFKAADTAMYQAKEAGRNRVVVAPD